MDALQSILDTLVGPNEGVRSLTLLQVGVRAALTYLFGYFLLRIGEHRFVGKNTAFDVVLGFIFGATLSRAINGAAPFFDTLLAGAVLLGLHWVFTWLAFRSERLDALLNGEAVRIVEDGALCEDRMRDQRINTQLLEENLRLRGNCGDLRAVQAAYYERSGAISVIPKRGTFASARAPQDSNSSSSDTGEDTPRVIEVQVKEGVQTVRIELV